MGNCYCGDGFYSDAETVFVVVVVVVVVFHGVKHGSLSGRLLCLTSYVLFISNPFRKT